MRLIGLALLLAAPPVSAQGFPGFSEADEEIIVGPSVKRGKARTLGTWSWTQEGVVLQEANPVGNSLWFPASEKARLADGALRIRLAFDGHGETTTLLFRAELPDHDLERFSGYGLTVSGSMLRFARWDAGIGRSQGAPMAVSGLRKRTGIEILLFMAGPLLSATVYDVETLEQLTTIAIADRRYTSGLVGLRAPHRHARSTPVTFLSALRSGRARRGDPSEPAGSKRLVRIARQAFGRLPVELHGRVMEGDADRLLLVLGLRGLERLRRAGIEPVSVSAEVPWRVLDAEYRAQRGRPPTALADGFRLDASYKDAFMVADLIRAYAKRFPSIASLQEIGRSVEGRPLLALKISDNAHTAESEPAMLLDGGQHGNELLPPEVVLDAIGLLLGGYGQDPRLTRMVDELEIWCIPLVNPDGNQAYFDLSTGAGRKNNRDTNGNGLYEPLDGVDLNRNFPFRWGSLGEIGSRTWPEHGRYRGPVPASEPETQALMALARREQPVAAISFHTSATVIMPPYAVDGAASALNDETWPIAEAVAEAAGRQPNNRTFRVTNRLYPVDGVWKDWLRVEFGTVALVVEGPYHNPRDRQRRSMAIEAGRPTWLTLFDRFLDGPSVSGRVLDPDGVGLVAEVRVAEVTPQEGESWSSRPRDGFYARFLPQPGRHTLVFEALDFVPTRLDLEINDWVAGVDVVLQPLAPSSVAE